MDSKYADIIIPLLVIKVGERIDEETVDRDRMNQNDYVVYTSQVSVDESVKVKTSLFVQYILAKKRIDAVRCKRATGLRQLVFTRTFACR